MATRNYETHMGFRPSVQCHNNSFRLENCILLGYNAASSGNYLPTFRDSVSVPSSRIYRLNFMSLIRRTKGEAWNFLLVPRIIASLTSNMTFTFY